MARECSGMQLLRHVLREEYFTKTEYLLVSRKITIQLVEAIRVGKRIAYEGKTENASYWV